MHLSTPAVAPVVESHWEEFKDQQLRKKVRHNQTLQRYMRSRLCVCTCVNLLYFPFFFPPQLGLVFLQRIHACTCTKKSFPLSPPSPGLQCREQPAVIHPCCLGFGTAGPQGWRDGGVSGLWGARGGERSFCVLLICLCRSAGFRLCSTCHGAPGGGTQEQEEK